MNKTYNQNEISEDKPIKILLENYNRTSKQYELAHQEIFEINLEHLRQLLNEIPLENTIDEFPIHIITEKVIIQKISEQEFSYIRNHKPRFFHRVTDYSKNTFLLQNLNNIINEWDKWKPHFSFQDCIRSKRGINIAFSIIMIYLIFSIFDLIFSLDLIEAWAISFLINLSTNF